jgi:hypothetical protein
MPVVVIHRRSKNAEQYFFIVSYLCGKSTTATLGWSTVEMPDPDAYFFALEMPDGLHKSAEVARETGTLKFYPTRSNRM